MKTSVTLKLLACTTMCLAFIFLIALFGCKKSNNDVQVDESTKVIQKSVADVLFAAAPGSDSKITQLSPDKKLQRILTPIISNGNLKLFKYILTEMDGEGNVFRIGRLLSKTKIDGDENLFSLPLAHDRSLNYFDANASKNTRSKVLMKTKGTKLTTETVADDLEDEIGSNLAPICTGGYCIDHWWITWDSQTGQIYSIEYEGSDCYEEHCSGGGGGGGGDGNGGGNGCNLTPTEAQVLLDLTTAESGDQEISTTSGGVTGPDEAGVIRVPKTVKADAFSLHIAGNWWVRWATNFAGIVYKRSIPHNDPWKWESVNYTSFSQYEGSLPPCTSAVPSVNCIALISGDKTNFQRTGNYFIILKWSCMPGEPQMATYSGTLTGSYTANINIPYE